VSLTLTPMLSSRFLRATHEATRGRFYRATERIYDRVLNKYERSLDWVMARRGMTLVFSGVILAATLILFVVMPKGLFPSDDQGQLLGITEAAQGASYSSLINAQAAVADIVRKNPDVQSVTYSVGTSAAANQGQLTIGLKPLGQRSHSADEVARQLTHDVTGVPDISVYFQNPPAISIGGLTSKSLYQFTLQSGDIVALDSAAAHLEARLRQEKQLENVTSDLLIDNPQVTVDIDRAQAGQLGVSATEIENTLYDSFGQRQVSTIYTSTNEYWVVMELLPEFQQDIPSLGSLWVRSTSGTVVPLSAVAKFTLGNGPVTVNHEGQLPAVTISFDLAPGVSLGSAVTTVKNDAKAILPPTVASNFSGLAQAFMGTQQGLTLLLALAVFVIYIILGVLYESYVHPITILSGLPFAVFGAIVTLLIFGLDLDVYSLVGMIMLIGIVKKNAIMMIDFAIEAERTDHSTPEQAIVKAASVRFRPIMMTTMAALMGALPIAIGWGAGASTRRPLGVAVVGGLAFSQLVTLYVTPVFYTYLDELQTWIRGRGRKRREAGMTVTPPPEAAGA